MEEWERVALVLCTFGLLKEIRPSEPYVSEFLVGPWRNITKETLNRDVYPVATYANLFLLIIVFLVTDYLRYKPVIIASGISGIIIYVILLWTSSLEWLQVSQFFYAIYVATDVAYYTYMFAKVEKDKYRQVASYTRSSALFGRFISGASSQLLVYFDVLDYRQLNYITLTSQILATAWVLFLPPVKKSIYFHRDLEASMIDNNEHVEKRPANEGILRMLWIHIKSAFTKNYVIAWSIWYAASTAGYYQVQTYIQILWIEVELGEKNIYNGLIKAIITILAALAALFAGLWKFKNQSIYNVFPAFAAALQAGVILMASYTTSIWLCYFGYICLSITYHFMITIASFLIAKKLEYNNCFGLIFGINTLFALIIQSILTFVLISKQELAVRSQYKAYAVYYMILSISCFVCWITSCIKKKKSARNEQSIKENTIE